MPTTPEKKIVQIRTLYTCISSASPLQKKIHDISIESSPLTKLQLEVKLRIK